MEKVKPKMGFSESELRAKYDNTFKIREGLKQLKDGVYFTDQQMRDLCRVNATQWRGYSDAEEFAKYKIKMTGGVLYWGLPANVKKLREDLNCA